MKKLLWIIAILILGSLGAMFALSLTSKRPNELGPTADGKLRPCPDTPNCVCSCESTGDSAIEPFQLQGEPADELALLTRLISDHPQAEVVSNKDGYIHAEFTSRFFRYVDDVEFLVAPDEGVIHVRSASRAGHSDLGANRKRVEILRIQFEAVSERTPPVEEEPVAKVEPEDDPADGERIRSRKKRKQTEDQTAQPKEGAAAAHADIAAGRLFILEQPLPYPPWYNTYSSLLKSEYGVKIKVVSHPDAQLTDLDKEYNEIMLAEIERKFGKGALSKMKAKAQE